MSPIVSQNVEEKQFEIIEGDERAELVYKIRNGALFLIHTWVPESLGGKGYARALAEYALNYALQENLKLAIICPYVQKYIMRHPEWYEYYHPKYTHYDPNYPNKA